MYNKLGFTWSWSYGGETSESAEICELGEKGE